MLPFVIGLIVGGLVGVALVCALAVWPPDDRQLDPESSFVPDRKDRLSPGLPPDTAQGEPPGSRGADPSGPERADRTPGRADRTAGWSAPSDSSRPGRRVASPVGASTPMPPRSPSRRDRRGPSVGWARLYYHAPRDGAGWAPYPAQEPREDGEEQWSWG